MDHEIQLFHNDEFGEIRTVIIEGEPWFVGKDVASILGYADHFGALKKHVDTEDKQNCQNDSFETPRGLTVINESGVYSLILSSKMPNAKKFKRWVTSEILPTLRKTGVYVLNDDALIQYIAPNADLQTLAYMRTALGTIHELNCNISSSKMLRPNLIRYSPATSMRTAKSMSWIVSCWRGW